jgi:nucleoid DNA-binding protein
MERGKLAHRTQKTRMQPVRIPYQNVDAVPQNLEKLLEKQQTVSLLGFTYFEQRAQPID